MNKQIFILLCLAILSFVEVSAQDMNGFYKKKYRNLGFTTMLMHQDDAPNLKSNYGATFTLGRTYYLHKIPIAKSFRFGIDATWLDVNYTNYRIKYIAYGDTGEYNFHQGEFSLHVGPSIVFNPIGKMNVHGYFRFAPTFSVLYADDTFYGNYASFFVGGGALSYSSIGLGIESRFGKCDYKEFGRGEEGDILKTKFSGWRVYVTFRF